MAQTVRFYPSHIILGLVLIVLQSTLLAKLGGFNLLVILVLHLAAAGEFLSGGLLVLFFGLVQDLLSGATAGLSSLIYLLIYFGGCLIRRHLHLDHPLHQIVAVVLAASLGQMILARSVGQPLPTLGQWVRVGLVALLSPLIFRFFYRVEAWQARLTRPRTVD